MSEPCITFRGAGSLKPGSVMNEEEAVSRFRELLRERMKMAAAFEGEGRQSWFLLAVEVKL